MGFIKNVHDCILPELPAPTEDFVNGESRKLYEDGPGTIWQCDNCKKEYVIVRDSYNEKIWRQTID